jgi:hypothetical protein
VAAAVVVAGEVVVAAEEVAVVAAVVVVVVGGEPFDNDLALTIISGWTGGNGDPIRNSRW